MENEKQNTKRSNGIYFPRLETRTWESILDDPEVGIVITNSSQRARSLCRMGVPAIAVTNYREAEASLALDTIISQQRRTNGGAHE